MHVSYVVQGCEEGGVTSNEALKEGLMEGVSFVVDLEGWLRSW